MAKKWIYNPETGKRQYFKYLKELPKPLRKEYKQKHPNFGRKLSEETKRKISEGVKRYWESNEGRARRGLPPIDDYIGADDILDVEGVIETLVNELESLDRVVYGDGGLCNQKEMTREIIDEIWYQNSQDRVSLEIKLESKWNELESCINVIAALPDSQTAIMKTMFRKIYAIVKGTSLSRQENINFTQNERDEEEWMDMPGGEPLPFD